MTGPDRSKLPHGLRIPVTKNLTVSVNTSKIGTLNRFSDDYDPIFALCGRIILEWSTTEDLLNVILSHTWRNEIVQGIEETEERPKSLKRKLAFLRKAFRPDGPLSDASDEVRNVLKFVSQTGNRRHDIAHLHLAKITKTEDNYYLEMHNLEGRHITVSAGHLKGLLSDVYESQNALLAVTFNYASLIHTVATPRRPLE